MKIDSIKNMRHVAKIIKPLKPDQRALWDIVFNESISGEELLNENGRCYIISLNNTIFKIGYSDCKGGIKNTISTYRTAGNSGRPSDRTHGVHVLIALALENDMKVDFWYSSISPTRITLELIDGHTESHIVSVSGKHLELGNIEIYKSLNHQRYPMWNLQEAGIKWPDALIETRMNLINKKMRVDQDKIIELLKTEDIKKLLTII